MLFDLFLWGSALGLIAAYVWLAFEATRANGSLASVPAARKFIHIAAWGWAAFYVMSLAYPLWAPHSTKVIAARLFQFILVLAVVSLIRLNRELRCALGAAQDER